MFTTLIIMGPTAVGKTALAITLAKKYGTEIISADSRQCFLETTIAVAKPSSEELAEVRHHFINSHSIHEEMNAALFEEYALSVVSHLQEQYPLAVMVGGTGLYIRAFYEGLDELPQIEPGIRESIIDEYEAKGLAWLQEAIRLEDPLFYATGEVLNPQRLMRALEVVRSTGRSIRSFQVKQVKQRPFRVVKLGLDLPREVLYERINRRVDLMMEVGLLEEARTLYPYRHLNALQTVGYTELFDHFDGKHSLEEAITLIKRNTRHYAKRQLTWFRRDEQVTWFSPDDSEGIGNWLPAAVGL
nr:tRNA (adenosine(37)-N6)-dimethylallyltransferase MiaA [Flavihumibacter rivuli]